MAEVMAVPGFDDELALTGAFDARFEDDEGEQWGSDADKDDWDDEDEEDWDEEDDLDDEDEWDEDDEEWEQDEEWGDEDED